MRVIKNTIDALKKQAQELGAGQAHMNVGFEDGSSAAVSVYIGQRPSHLILDELYEWAEATGNQQIIDKIEELSELKN